MLALVSGCGCPRVSFRNTKGLFRSAAVFGREKVAPYFRYSCPNPSLHRLRRKPQIVFLVYPMKKLTVMVVDDEPVVADTILEILKEEGIDGFAFPSGHAALNWFSRINPDAVIMDVVMPGISGIAAAIEMRKQSPACRVILFSGQTSTTDLLNEARAQGHEFEGLEKPIKPEVLLAQLLGQHGPCVGTSA